MLAGYDTTVLPYDYFAANRGAAVSTNPIKTRDDAWAVLTEFTQSDSLLKHALSVEAAVKAYAHKYRQDELLWGMAGMLHDFDYERYPDINEHATVGGRVLTERGFPANVVHAVMAHNEATGVPRDAQLDKVVFAVDELSGLITATALVRPSKSIFEVDAASVRKKMKDKAFARNVSRDDILKGIAELGVSFEEHVTFVIEAMQAVAPVIGLQGNGEARAG